MADKQRYDRYIKFANDTVEDWASYYEIKDTTWHNGRLNPYFEKYYQMHLKNDQKSTFLIPLCGKCVDMIWLAKLGNRVIGIEFVQQACVEFFKENNLQYKVDVEEIGDVYRSQETKLDITIYNCNFYSITPEILGCKCDRFWDCASIFAIPPKEHIQYIKQLTSLLTTEAQGLLFSVEYNIDERLKPESPFSVPESRIRECFSSFASVELLESASMPPSMYKHLGLTFMIGKYFLLKLK